MRKFRVVIILIPLLKMLKRGKEFVFMSEPAIFFCDRKLLIVSILRQVVIIFCELRLRMSVKKQIIYTRKLAECLSRSCLLSDEL